MITSTIHATSFPETTGSYRLISFTGAGGKTSLIQWVASTSQHQKQTVLVTTTTKILPPSGERIILEEDGPAFMKRLHEAVTLYGKVTVARRFEQATGKLIGLRPETVTTIHNSGMADRTLVEADGAARKPLKAPNDNEPVIPQATDFCIAVMGLDAINRPLDDRTVHRPEIFSQITHLKTGQSIAPESLISVATAPNGLFKGCPPDADLAVFLNKMDIPGHVDFIGDFERKLAHQADGLCPRWFAGSAHTHLARELVSIPGHTHAITNNNLSFFTSSEIEEVA